MAKPKRCSGRMRNEFLSLQKQQVKRVFLAGKGSNELGSWAKESQYQDGSFPGILETLLKKVNDSGWQMYDSIKWQHIHKYESIEISDENSCKGDEDNAYRACFIADEKGFHIIAFSRDSDGEKKRITAIKRGISRLFQSLLRYKSSAAAPCLASKDGSLLFPVLRKLKHSLRDKVEKKLREENVEPKNTAQLVGHIQQYNAQMSLKMQCASIHGWAMQQKSCN